MVSDLLKRHLAPLTPEAFAAVDAEAARVLKLSLTARPLVDFRGPSGWRLAAVNTGRLDPISSDGLPGVELALRRAQPMVEMRVPLRLSLAELDAVSRGAADPDLTAVITAAKQAAQAEDAAIFNGSTAAGITGIIPGSPHAPHNLPADARELSGAVLAAREVLLQAGIGGPYALALAIPIFDQVLATVENGQPLAERLTRHLLDGLLVRAPVLEGGVLLSLRGGDYQLHVGQDFSVAYTAHDRQSVELHITESFTFRSLEPAAAVPLRR